MPRHLQIHSLFALVLLISALCFGVIASWAFLYPETYNTNLPFYQLRPFHVSSALFWIITGATFGILNFKQSSSNRIANILERVFIYTWIINIVVIFYCYATKQFGGREYWEFPPVLSIPLFICWVFLLLAYFIPWVQQKDKSPLYVWMWSTGIIFFFITFLEQNLWQIQWFRASFLREMTVQWKANGATVGAWNQMIYGTALFLMVKISGDVTIATSKKAFFFYFLGLINLMFNWGHHIYNLPTSSWIRNVSYLISMTEVLFFINIINGFRNKLNEKRKYQHITAYRFLIAAEFWVFANLFLVLLISIPAINRYTHGTHITVAHAMVATIGINTMILLGSFAYVLRIDEIEKGKTAINIGYWGSQISLSLFWLALIIAGIIKGYRTTALQLTNFNEIMRPAMPFLKLFSIAGIGLLMSIGTIAIIYIIHLTRSKQYVNS